jgi:hypothetical protein
MIEPTADVSRGSALGLTADPQAGVETPSILET